MAEEAGAVALSAATAGAARPATTGGAAPSGLGGSGARSAVTGAASLSVMGAAALSPATESTPRPTATGAAAGSGAARTAALPAAGPSARRWLGLAIVAGGVLAAGHASWRGLVALDPRVGQALIGGSLAAAATAAGTLPALFAQRSSERGRDALMGFGAGVMLAAAAFSLIVPALAAARAQGAGPWLAAGTVGAGLLAGAALLLALDCWLPHEHFLKGPEGSPARARRLRRTWLFVFAIALHNVPEGLAIGVAYAGTDPLAAGVLATGIAVQDIPEGLVIALALVAAGYARGPSVALGAASGLVEPAAAVLGSAVMTLSAGLLPWGLAFAAGAMLFVISHEIIPESHRQGHERYATAGLMLGFVLMMVLDTALV